MPDFSGLDLQRYLNRINKKIPTIVITAFDDAGIRERSAASGLRPSDQTFARSDSDRCHLGRDDGLERRSSVAPSKNGTDN
jgi:hypothetical protein